MITPVISSLLFRLGFFHVYIVYTYIHLKLDIYDSLKEIIIPVYICFKMSGYFILFWNSIIPFSSTKAHISKVYGIPYLPYLLFFEKITYSYSFTYTKDIFQNVILHSRYKQSSAVFWKHKLILEQISINLLLESLRFSLFSLCFVYYKKLNWLYCNIVQCTTYSTCMCTYLLSFIIQYKICL